jgi:hypothetical protein
MRRSIVILAVCDLVLCVLAVLAIVVSPALLWAGIAGLGVAAIVTFALVLAARRPASAARSETVSRPDRAGVADFEEATSLRNQPTWRDDVEGRTGPKW